MINWFWTKRVNFGHHLLGRKVRQVALANNGGGMVVVSAWP
jgi:hypothetical protein